MKKYVLGFAFSSIEGSELYLVLIQKNRPEWQAGKLNGIGGKVEEGETSLEAMVREFEEETTVKTTPDQWKSFGTMNFENDIMGGSAEVELFKMFDDIIFNCKTNEDEEILIRDAYTVVLNYDCMHNLPILIPLALSREFNYVKLSDVRF